jgi:hypothetical protein
MSTALAEIVKKEELEPTQSEQIIQHFAVLLDEAKGWEAKAKAIIVTDEKQLDVIADARKTRLALKAIRVKAEHKRKELKEGIVRQGRAIDGINNVIVALIAPLEEHLEKQEKFAERLQQERLDRLDAERRAELGAYVGDTSAYNLRAMTPEAYAMLLETSRIAHEAQKEAERKAEEERQAKEKAEAEERERLATENARLKAEAEAREKAEAERKAEADRLLAEERAKAEAERKAAEEAARIEREAREKAEAELRAKEEEERKERERIAAEKAAAEKAAAEEARQAALKPDKEKLLDYADRIKSLEAPRGLSAEASDIVAKAEQMLLNASHGIREAVKKL